MKKIILVLSIFICLLAGNTGFAEDAASPAFVTIPLGTRGGLIEGDLSSYLLAPAGDSNFIALDAGTLLTGLKEAVKRGSFGDLTLPEDSGLTFEGWLLQDKLKAYLISHAHIDHVAGLVINSPDDSAKPIIGLPATIDNIRDHLFNWKIWPNFGNEGPGFQLKKYQYTRVQPGEIYPVEGTNMTFVPFELSHSGDYLSTAYLVEANDAYALYFGDTGPDDVEQSSRMQAVWQHVAPLVRAGKLRAIFLESSYPDPRDPKRLFGHLTPEWMMKELHKLALLVDSEHPQQALKNLTVLVTHMKPSLKKEAPRRDQMQQQLSALNDLQIHFLFPERGERIEF